jgi:hypothetical protein
MKFRRSSQISCSSKRLEERCQYVLPSECGRCGISIFNGRFYLDCLEAFPELAELPDSERPAPEGMQATQQHLLV